MAGHEVGIKPLFRHNLIFLNVFVSCCLFVQLNLKPHL